MSSVTILVQHNVCKKLYLFSAKITRSHNICMNSKVVQIVRSKRKHVVLRLLNKLCSSFISLSLLYALPKLL